MAELLLGLDVVNAINLDGGGSATAVDKGTVVNYPSDYW
jgi:N-acetylglucosamine-1-phosphodiester alpha-N-acetylglucosaminidase